MERLHERVSSPRCIAFRESTSGNSVIYVPCGLLAVESKRFCKYHAKVFRELMLGIIMDGKKYRAKGTK